MSDVEKSDSEKPELRPANENPWYCLATLHGEQPMATPRALKDGKWDSGLATKNRATWNRWIAGGLSKDQFAALVKAGFSEAELVPFTPEEKIALSNAFARRAGRQQELPPNPTAAVDFSHVCFDRLFHFGGFLCAGKADFSSASFSGDADFLNTVFAERTVFAEVQFHTFVPDFRGAKMHEATEWHGVHWPSAPRDKAAAQVQVYAYERPEEARGRAALFPQGVACASWTGAALVRRVASEFSLRGLQ